MSRKRKNRSIGFLLFWALIYAGLCWAFEAHLAEKLQSNKLGLWGGRTVAWALALSSVFELLNRVKNSWQRQKCP